jgi:peptidoglycan/LPS O-acetylase OafA/YrhL
MYIIAPGILALGRRWPLLLLAISLVVVMFLEFASLGTRHWTDWTYYFGVLRAFPSFVFGAFLYYARVRIGRIGFGRTFLTLTLVSFFALPIVWPGLPLEFTLLDLYLVAVAAVIVDQSRQVPEVVRKLARLSPLTYGTYMWHPLVFTVVVVFAMDRVLGLSGATKDIAVLFTGLGVLVVAFVSLVLFENPARRWLTIRMAPSGERVGAAAPAP